MPLSVVTVAIVVVIVVDIMVGCTCCVVCFCLAFRRFDEPPLYSQLLLLLLLGALNANSINLRTERFEARSVYLWDGVCVYVSSQARYK